MARENFRNLFLGEFITRILSNRIFSSISFSSMVFFIVINF